MKKTYTSIILCIAAFLLSAPFGFADGDQATNGMFLKKTSTYDYAKHEGTITMESYVEGIVKVIKSSGAADIVLALDESSSMDATELKNMKTAVTTFVNKVYEHVDSKGADHYVSIFLWGFKDPDVLCGLTSAKTQRSTIDAAIQKIPTNKTSITATRHNSAMQKAKEILSGAREGTNHYLVYFTDDDNTSNGEFAPAIQTAKEIKDMGVTIYVIGYSFSHFQNESSKRILRSFCNSISSNHPTATSSVQDYTSHGYFAEVDDGSSAMLEPIFQTFSSEILQGLAAVVLKETTIVDYINNDNFMLPEGMETDVSKIKLYVQSCTAATFDKNTMKCTCTFGPKTELTESTTPKRSALTVEMVEKDENQGVKVSGFNLSENWCGLDFDNKGNSTPRGKKLLVEIPYVFKGSEDPGELETNTPSSGIYEDGKEVGEYNIPKIEFCNLKIVRKGLDKGESAIFIITEKESGKFVCRLTLGGTGKGDVSATIKGLPAGQYTVKETSWNWAYHINEVTQTSSISGETVFTFTGSHRTGEATTPQHHQNHDEKFIKNKMHFTK